MTAKIECLFVFLRQRKGGPRQPSRRCSSKQFFFSSRNCKQKSVKFDPLVFSIDHLLADHFNLGAATFGEGSFVVGWAHPWAFVTTGSQHFVMVMECWCGRDEGEVVHNDGTCKHASNTSPLISMVVVK